MFQSINSIADLTVSTHHDNGHPEALVTHPADELKTVHTGHLQVYKDSVERLFTQKTLSRERILGPYAVDGFDS